MNRIAICALLLSTTAQAAFVTENEFQSMLDHNDVRAEAYIAGVVDGSGGRKFCIPKSKNLSDLTQEVRLRFERASTRDNVQASWVIQKILEGEYPCREVP